MAFRLSWLGEQRCCTRGGKSDRDPKPWAAWTHNYLLNGSGFSLWKKNKRSKPVSRQLNTRVHTQQDPLEATTSPECYLSLRSKWGDRSFLSPSFSRKVHACINTNVSPLNFTRTAPQIHPLKTSPRKLVAKFQCLSWLWEQARIGSLKKSSVNKNPDDQVGACGYLNFTSQAVIKRTKGLKTFGSKARG